MDDAAREAGDREPAFERADRPNADLLTAHLVSGHELIPLHKPGRLGKQPRDPGWPTADYSGADPRAWMAAGLNVGVRLSDEDVVMDFDEKNFTADRPQPVEDFCREFGISLSDCLAVRSGSGWHLYFKKPASLAVKSKLDGWPEIEVWTRGHQMVASGSLHQSGRLYRATPNWLDEFPAAPAAPQRLLDALTKQAKEKVRTASGEVSPELLEEMLGCLDPADYRDYDPWIALAMSCHHATAGNGRDEFISWCVADDPYRDHAERIATHWDSFDEETEGVTANTLYKAVSAAGRNDLVEKAKRRSAEEDFADAPPIELSQLDVRPTTGGLRDWVWVASATCFVRLSDGTKFTDKQWKSMHAHLKPDGDIVNAVFRGATPVRRFEQFVYLPGAPTFPDGERGKRYNAWRPSNVVAKEGDASWFVEHMEYLIPDERERGFVLDYLASIVQRPADKAQFALLIRGDQGTGKSAVGELMRRIVGEHNVVKPNNDEIVNRFNTWQIEGHLAVVEELMTLGKMEAANRLKPIITEPLLRVEMKGMAPFSTPNHLNLLCFTNHRDALRVEDGDRRWLVVFSPAKPRGAGYYRRLFERIASDEGAAAVKHMLATRRVELDTKGRAPETLAKDEMRALSRNEAEAHLQELFEQKAAPFDHDLVRLEEVVEALPESIRRRQKNIGAIASKFLQDSLGAVKQGRYTKAGGGRPKYQLYSLRNHDEWEALGASKRIDAYVEHKSRLFDPVE